MLAFLLRASMSERNAVMRSRERNLSYGTAFFAWRRGAKASARGLCSWSAPVSKKRLGLSRSPRRQGYGRCLPQEILTMHYRSIPASGLQARTVAVGCSRDPLGLDLTFLTLVGRTCGWLGPSVGVPIWQVVWLHAVRALIPGHDVSRIGRHTWVARCSRSPP